MLEDRSIIEERVDSERVFDGIILHIDHMNYRLPNGNIARRE